MLKNFLSSVCAGVLISIGGCVFLACENRYVGAVLFSVALLCICLKGYALYTGRVGYIIESHKKSDFAALAVILIGNLITTFLLGMLVRVSMPQLGETAAAICSGKLTQAFWQTLVRAFFCGILMYLAVSTYKEKNTVLGILFCVPVFILSGFEHFDSRYVLFRRIGHLLVECRAVHARCCYRQLARRNAPAGTDSYRREKK